MVHDGIQAEKNGFPLLEVRDLKTWFPIKRGLFSLAAGYVRAVDGVSFVIRRNDRLSSGEMKPWDWSGSRVAARPPWDAPCSDWSG